MSDAELLVERLETTLDALKRIPRRFAAITTPDDFTASDAGIDRIPTLITTVETMIAELNSGDVA